MRIFSQDYCFQFPDNVASISSQGNVTQLGMNNQSSKSSEDRVITELEDSCLFNLT